MKALLIWLACLFCLPLIGQDQSCADIILENKTLGSTQLIKTHYVRVIVRSNYTYSMGFVSNDKGLLISVRTRNGGVLNPNDEVIFIDASQERRRFRFVGDGEIVSVNGAPAYENTLQIDHASAKWLAKQKIATFYVVNHLYNRMRKLSLQSLQQEELLTAAKCFTSVLDLSKLKNVPLLTTDEPRSSVDEISNHPTPRERTQGTKGGELNELSDDLVEARKRLRAEIALEEEKLLQLKSQLQSEVQLAYEEAEKAKAQYAQDVFDARKRSQEEITAVEEETQHMVFATRERAKSVVTAYHADIDTARAQAYNEIQTAKIKAAEKVAEIRRLANIEIARLSQNLDEVRQAYADELNSARENSTLEIEEIRKETADEIKRANQALDNSKQLTIEEVVAVKENSNQELLQMQEQLALDIGKLRQDAVLERERIAVSMAELHRANAEEKAIASQTQEELMREMLERFTQEKTEQITSLAELKREIGEEMAALKQLSRDEKEVMAQTMLALKASYADSLKTAYQLRDEQLIKIANELSKNRSQYERRIDSVKYETTKQITELRQAQETEANRIAYELEEVRIRVDQEKLELMEGLQRDYKRLDSLMAVAREDANDKIVEIRNRTQSAIKASESNTSEIISSHRNALSQAQFNYAGDVRDARERAQQKIDQIENDLQTQVDQINRTFDEKLNERTQSLEEVQQSSRKLILEAQINAQRKLANIATDLAIAEKEGEIKIAQARENSANALADISSGELQRRQLISTRTQSAIDSMQKSIHEANANASQKVSDIQRKALEEIEKSQRNVAEELLRASSVIATSRLESGDAIRAAKERAMEEITAIQRATYVAISNQQEHQDSLQGSFNKKMVSLRKVQQSQIDSMMTLAQSEVIEIIQQTNEKKLSYIKEGEEVRSNVNAQISDIRMQFSNDIYEAQKDAAAQITEVKAYTGLQIQNITKKAKTAQLKLDSLLKEVELMEAEVEHLQKKIKGND